MKCTACSRAERSSPADGVSSCKQSSRLSLSSAAPLKNTTKTSCFFNLCKIFCTNLCDLFQKSHVEPVVCARRLRILRALIAFSCQQQLILSAFIDVNFGESVVCFGFFQLEDIVDIPLIHRPYGFIVQFLMINTGNGGSFVQL